MNYADYDSNYNIHGLRSLLVSLGGTPGSKNKTELIEEIIKIENGEKTPARSRRGRPNLNAPHTDPVAVLKDSEEGKFSEVRGVLELNAEGYGFIRAENYSISSKDAFIAKPTIKENHLREGDMVFGKVLYKRETNSRK